MENIMNIVKPYAGRVSYGAVLGGCAGYALKKVTKVAGTPHLVFHVCPLGIPNNFESYRKGLKTNATIRLQ